MRISKINFKTFSK